MNIVETVAHMMSAVRYFGDVDVICDIGGQDIKVLFMKNGDIANFKLSNSCSAGNGMLLQAMADQFGLKVTEYADTAFQAELAPKFSYGCAVFLDTDRVNFQKEGFSKEELLAGLAQVLPKNVWQYVVQIPRMASLGKRFVLQGGTQYNLAAVKAQVDYIKERVPGAEVFVHPHTGEAGALGAAFETLRVVKRKGQSTFIGLDAAINLEFETRNDDSTTCHFCPNECKRTFIDAKRPDGSNARYISGFSCEKGTVESEEAMLALVAERKKIAKQFPNLVDYEARRAFISFFKHAPMPAEGTPVKDWAMKRGFFSIKKVEVTRGFRRASAAAQERLKRVRIGMPRVLNMYSTAPYFRAYFEALGLQKQNVVFSDETTEEMWVEGGKYGSVDPCFPSKVAQAHIHNLLFHHHTPEKKLNYIFFPILTHVPSFGEGVMDKTSCPIVSGVPEVMKAAFTKEQDFFATRGIEYLDPALTFSEMNLTARRMFDTWGPRLGITEDESDHAHHEGMKALEQFDEDLQDKGRAILETVEDENRVAILMVGRPYHSDPGLNHGIPEEFQVLGYPILSVRSLPRDEKYLARYFKEEIAEGDVAPARHQRRVAGELLGQQRAEGVGREVRRAAPQRRAARPLELQVRPRRAHLRHRRQHRDRRGHALRGAPRHRREQARRVDQDPREDLRALAQAPRGAPRGPRPQAHRVRRGPRPEAPRAPAPQARAARRAHAALDPALERQIDDLAASASRAYKPESAARPSCPRASWRSRRRPPTAPLVPIQL